MQDLDLPPGGTPASSGRTEFAILGAGAIGSIVAAHLARAGHSVLLLARGQRARDVAQSGIRITGLAEFTQTVPVLTEPSRFKSAEVLILATKTHGTGAALDAIRHAKIQAALSLQNGLMKNDQLSAVWGPDHVLGALADTSGELLPSGETLFTRNEAISIGELHGGESGERARRIAGALDASGVRARAVTGVQSLEWSKFAAWAGLMIGSITTRAPTWRYLSDPGTALVLVRLIREMGALAAALGIPLSDQAPLPVAAVLIGSESQAVDRLQAAGARMRSVAPAHRMSSLQDLEGGRPLEVEETLGHAARLAARFDLSLPLLTSSYALAAGIDRIGRLGSVSVRLATADREAATIDHLATKARSMT